MGDGHSITVCSVPHHTFRAAGIPTGRVKGRLQPGEASLDAVGGDAARLSSFTPPFFLPLLQDYVPVVRRRPETNRGAIKRLAQGVKTKSKCIALAIGIDGAGEVRARTPVRCAGSLYGNGSRGR